MNNEKYIIRQAIIADLEQLFTMLVDLVKHEGTFEYFKLTKERLEKELFGINADWNCLVATYSNEKLVGFCLYSYANTNRAFSTTPLIQIDDLYVSPEYRNAKIGQKLMHQLALIAKCRNISRFNVFCVKDNIQGQNFYQKIGGEKLEFLDIYKIQVDKLLD